MGKNIGPKLKRNLEFTDLMAIAIGQIIGAGIMSTTGVAIGMTGTGVVLAFLLSPIFTIITIYPSAVLSSAVPATGGPYVYTSRLMGKIAGMLYLLLFATAYGVAMSQFSLSFGMYFASLVPSVSMHTAAMVALTLFYILNLLGTRSAAVVNKVITIALFGGLALFVAFGMPNVDFGYVMAKQNLLLNGWLPFVSTLALLSSATAGAQFIAELGGEAKNPGKNIPMAMISSTLGVGIVYVLIALVAAGILPIDQVANQPLTLVAKETMPQVPFLLFVIGAALGATSSTLNSTFSWITKPFLAASDDGLLPKSFGSLNSKGVPYKLLTFFYVAGMIPLVLNQDISIVTKFTTANSLLIKVFVCIALYQVARYHGDALEACDIGMSASKAKLLAIVALVVLLVLSYSLFLTMSWYVVVFLGVLLILSVIYSKTALRDLVISNDLFDCEED